MSTSAKIPQPTPQTQNRDKYLIIPKALYFLCSCYMYAPSLYQAKYLEDVWKISAKNYGYLNLVTIFAIFASLAWSGLADRYRAHKRILMLKSLLYGLSYCSMWFLEPFMINWTKQVRVMVITGLFFLITVCCSSIFPLLGTLVFSILESSDSLRNGPIPPKRLLGRQKLFGTLGLGMVFAINGTLTDFIGYRAQFLIVSITCLLFFLIAHFGLKNTPTSFHKVPLETSKTWVAPDPKKQSEPSWGTNVKILLSNWDFLLLLLIVFLIGVAGSVFNVYFSIFMSMILENSTWKNRIMGYMYAVRLTVEIPIYIWGNILIGAFGSYGVLLMGMAASALRPFGYSFLMKDESVAYLGFIFELCKGFSHACNGLGGCVLASDMAPPGAQGMAQALFTSAHHHAASVVSGLLCSLYLNIRKENNAPTPERILIYRDLFFWTGVIGLIGTALNIYRLVIHKTKSRR
jgi:Na+/melibiose symporter-like transporter